MLDYDEEGAVLLHDRQNAAHAAYRRQQAERVERLQAAITKACLLLEQGDHAAALERLREVTA